MSNFGSEIVSRENTEDAIRMLAAQKEIYSLAKTLAFLQTLIVAPIPVIISIGCLYFDLPADQSNTMFVAYTIIGSVSEILLEFWIKNLKIDAASIQEAFDTYVLGLKWNRTLIPNKPDSGLIYRYYSKHIKRNNLGILKNWYSSEVNKVPGNIAVVICQRTNCTYDFLLKKRYAISVMATAVVVFLVLLGLALYDDMTLRAFFIKAFAPSLPIIIWCIKRTAANKDAVKTLCELKNQIENILENSEINSTIKEVEMRQIQDRIYCSRISSPMLPDWLFQLYRNGLENVMDFTVTSMVKELSEKPKNITN